MKKATLLCLREDRDAVLRALQRCGEFMPVACGDGEPPKGGDNPAAKEEALLQKLKPYRAKKGFLAQRPVVKEDVFEQDDAVADAVANEAEQAVTALQALESRRQTLLDKYNQLLPWKALTFPAQELHNTAFSHVFTGYVPAQIQEEIVAAVKAAGGEPVMLAEGSDGFAAYVVCAAEDTDAVEAALKQSGFVLAALPFAEGTAAQALDGVKQQQDEFEQQQTALTAKLEEFGGKGDELELLTDRRRAQEVRESAPAAATDMTVYWQGWVRADRVDKLQKALDKAVDGYTLLLDDPAEDEDPPSVTQNNKFVTPFETITDMFSRPNKHELDPNPVMSVWYWLIFGMMMGDVGYGVLMFAGLLAFKLLKKPRGDMAKLVDVMFYASVPTIFFGVMYGSYFGESWLPPVFASPLNDPIKMLVASLIVGVLHIFSGMIIKMVEDFRAGHPWDAIFDQLSWILIITGCGLMFLPATFTVGAGLAVFGAAVVLFTAGRKAKGFGKITGGLLGLYGVTGFLSDILSYSRILALALSSGVIGMVMNLLAGMVRGEGFNILGILLSLVVYLIGHAFNIAMSLLSAYVHDSRLQYIEFFSKFYDGGGVPFKPLTRESKYVDVQTTE